MNMRALDLLPDYVLGALSPEERALVEAALRASAELREEAQQLAEAFGVLALELPPVAPSPALRARVLASAAGEKHAPFAPDLARYFDLAVSRVRELLLSIYDPQTSWDSFPIPGITVMHFAGGPAAATADCGFVRLTRGVHFPWHRHTGPEVNYVLEGYIKDYDGRIYGPGEAIVKAEGSEHEFWVADDGDALLAVVVSGFEIIPRQ